MIDKNDPRLTCFVLGELNPSDRAEIEDAIAGSEDLQIAVEEIRQTAFLLDAAYLGEAPLALRDEQKAELAKVQSQEKSPRPQRLIHDRPWLPVVLAASLLGMIVTTAIYLDNAPPSPAVASRIERMKTMDSDALEALENRAAAGAMPPPSGQVMDSPGESGLGLASKEVANKAVAGEEVVGGVMVDQLAQNPQSKLNRLNKSESFGTAEDVDESKNDISELSFGSRNQSLGQTDSESLVEADQVELLKRSDEMKSLKTQREDGYWMALQGMDKAAEQESLHLAIEGAGPASQSANGVLPAKGKMEFAENSPATGSTGFFAEGAVGDSTVAGREPRESTSRGAASARPADAIRGRRGFGRNIARPGGTAVPMTEGEKQRQYQALDAAGVEGLAGDSGSSGQGGFGGGGLGGGGGGVLGGQPAADASSPEVALTESGGMDRGSGDLSAFRILDPQAKPATESAVPKFSEIESETSRGGRLGETALSGKETRNRGIALDRKLANGGLRMKQSSSRPGSEQSLDEEVKGDGDAESKLNQRYSRQMDSNRSGSVTRGTDEDDHPSAPGDDLFENEKQLGTGATEESIDRLRYFGFEVEPSMQTRRKSRMVPVQRSRIEQRSRLVTGEDGATKMETFQVEVPYMENEEQDFVVQVPQLALSIAPKTTERIVNRLAAQLDPQGRREIKLAELLESNEGSVESSEQEDSGIKKDRMLARELREQLVEPDGQKGIFDIQPALLQVTKALEERNAIVRKKRSWKRVKATPNSTRMMVGDNSELDLTGMQVNVQVDGFRARVLLDYFYYNDRGRAFDGEFKLRLPDDASLYYFAFGESSYDLSPQGQLAEEEFLDDGTQFVSLGEKQIRDSRQDAWANVKEARMVTREKAAHAYHETIRRKVDPALAEWAGAGVFNAKVSPLAPHKLHRIVVGYDVNLTQVDDGWTYALDLPEQTGQCQVDINVQQVAGVEYSIGPKSDPVETKIGGRTNRRYRFVGNPKETIRLTAQQTPEVLIHSEAAFWGVRLKPDLPIENVAGNSRAIFMVDTSLSSNPDKFNTWLSLLESTLENNRDSLKQFNVVFFSVDAHFWKKGWVDNTPENVQQLLERCNTLALEGATDLYGAVHKIANTKWVHEVEPGTKQSSSPDLFLLSDGAANWGETNLRLINRQWENDRLGSLFAYQTGMTGTAIASLRFLAGQSGGAVFSVASEAEVKIASMAHRNRPWKLKSITAAGAKDVMTAGRIQWVYPGQSMTVVGRGAVDRDLVMEFEQTGQTKTVTVAPQQVASELASRLYGQVAVGQLEGLGAPTIDVAASYARYFRITGDTCSLLMLESEAEYKRFKIKPEEDLFVIKSKQAKELVADTLAKSADELADPKAQFDAWLDRLESMPGMSFEMPAGLSVVMDDIQIEAISQPLISNLARRDELSENYQKLLGAERLDYELISAEANRRAGKSFDDAIKVYSSLVERNPGDMVIARDVAFTAMEMKRPAQAYHLLRRVALARPYEGSIYPALGQCLTQLGHSDMAIVYYEIALGGSFERMGEDFQKIVAAEYMYLLRQIRDKKMKSSVPDFASARLETLEKRLGFDSANLLITMMWNTDQTDVDLHVLEPNGEECSYENKKTRSGGRITTDITTGFGPEMYSNPAAPSGKYDIQVKYFASNQNRSEMRNKVHLVIYRGYGSPDERVTRKTVQLKTVGKKEAVATVGVD